VLEKDETSSLQRFSHGGDATASSWSSSVWRQLPAYESGKRISGIDIATRAMLDEYELFQQAEKMIPK